MMRYFVYWRRALLEHKASFAGKIDELVSRFEIMASASSKDINHPADKT
jgi:hypothetical protein